MIIHTQPYRKDSGIKITKDEPYLVRPHRYNRKNRKKVRSSQYAQTIVMEWDHTRHKPLRQKMIIHDKPEKTIFRIF